VTRAQTFSSPLDVAATIMALVNYAIEFRRVSIIVSRVIDHIIDRGAAGGPKLLAYIAQHSSILWGGMTPAQRDRFLSVYRHTPIAIRIWLDLAQHRGLAEDEARLLAQAQDHPHRGLLANLLWHEIYASSRELTALECRAVDRLIEHANGPILRDLVNLAAAVSKASAASGTVLLLKVLRRNLLIGEQLHEPYEMAFDWRAIPAEEILSFSAGVASATNPPWLLVSLAASALRDGAIDIERTRSAFESLTAAHASAREAYARWRQRVSG
jgi:hypothetical protein